MSIFRDLLLPKAEACMIYYDSFAQISIITICCNEDFFFTCISHEDTLMLMTTETVFSPSILEETDHLIEVVKLYCQKCS